MSAVGKSCRDASAITRNFASAVPRLTQRLADPFRDGHSLPPGDSLNLQILLVIQEDL